MKNKIEMIIGSLVFSALILFDFTCFYGIGTMFSIIILITLWKNRKNNKDGDK